MNYGEVNKQTALSLQRRQQQTYLQIPGKLADVC